MAEGGWRSGRAGRAAVRSLHRQGGLGGSLACLRGVGPDRRPRGRHCRRRHGRGRGLGRRIRSRTGRGGAGGDSGAAGNAPTLGTFTTSGTSRGAGSTRHAPSTTGDRCDAPAAGSGEPASRLSAARGDAGPSTCSGSRRADTSARGRATAVRGCASCRRRRRAGQPHPLPGCPPTPRRKRDRPRRRAGNRFGRPHHPCRCARGDRHSPSGRSTCRRRRPGRASSGSWGGPSGKRADGARGPSGNRRGHPVHQHPASHR